MHPTPLWGSGVWTQTGQTNVRSLWLPGRCWCSGQTEALGWSQSIWSHCLPGRKENQYKIVYKLKRIVIFWYLAAEVYQVGVRVIDWEHDAVAELKRCNYYKESRFGSEATAVLLKTSLSRSRQWGFTLPGVKFDHDNGVIKVARRSQAVLPFAVLCESRCKHLWWWNHSIAC